MNTFSTGARWLCLVVLVAILPGGSAEIVVLNGTAGRLKVTLNDGWSFHKGDLEAGHLAGLTDSTWVNVDLPHTWNAEDAFDKRPEYYRGVGWYRRVLNLVDAGPDKRHFIHFEGANQVADVYVNGQHVGQHIGGYTAFTVDATDQLRGDGADLIAVRVDNSHDPNIPPLNADFTFYGGIYRDVWLITTSDVHFNMLDYGGPGVYAVTPSVSETAAALRVRGSVKNDRLENAAGVLTATLFDPQYRPVASTQSTIEILAGSISEFILDLGEIADPKLWSPEAPNLYGVTVAISVEDLLRDVIRVPLGFRWFRADADDGFWLNGKRTPLYGTNRHQDYPTYGNAVPDEIHRRDVNMIKQNGFNFLRLAHYPQDPAVLEEADRLGLLVWEEIPIVNLITISEAFATNSENMLREMIRQHHNHPSIVMWGYMNEVMLREPRPEIPEGYYERLLDLANRLETISKEEDGSRLTAMAQSLHEVYNGRGLSDVSDVLGMNLYFGWYYHDFETFGAFLDSLHAAHPSRPLMISEYGAGSDERVHTRQPRAFDFSTEHAQAYHRSAFLTIRERPYLVGSGVWNQFDFGSSHRQDTKNAINQKGLYFFDRTPKDVSYYYKAHLANKPVLHVERERLSRAGSIPGDSLYSLRVYSNHDTVRLMVNGVPYDARATANATTVWDVGFIQGSNNVEAIGTTESQTDRDRVVVRFEDRRPMFTSFTPLGSEIAVNSGAHYSYVDDEGRVWEPDRDYHEGPWGGVGGRGSRIHHRIYGSHDDPLLQSTRIGAAHYRFDVSAGLYEVEFVAAETERKQEGHRVFNLAVNAVPFANGLDLTAL
ncbi:MAG: beta galactosidase jelly roll domain-containing protein, partial [Rhodothermia bacterium]|nr:beta galactosidase jelly roll domain-containing protein [Rhodothermia bacterium]